MQSNQTLESNRVYRSDTRVIALNGRTGYCSTGIRAFFEKYNLDYAAFLENGILIEELETLNDSMADAVVRYVKNGRK